MDSPGVQLFVTCLVDSVTPEVGKATVAVLENLGCDVSFPEGQACCGQPAYNVGLNDEARKMAGQTLDVLDGTEGPVVVPSGSCAEMMIHHYPEFFEGTDRADQASRIAGRTRELTQFIDEDLDEEVRAECGDCTVAVHYSCHGLRGLGLGASTDSVLAGVDRVPLQGDDECCGFGGLFAIEMPAVSAAIMDVKLDNIEASGADTVVATDVSCLLHIEGGLRRRESSGKAKHVAELRAGGNQ
ncbi:MAG: (Fe-S)-binding protein [Acidimicrobiia bacterium]